MVSVYKRGKVYWLRFMRDGVEVRRTTGMSDKRAAQDFASEFRTNYAKGGMKLAAPPKSRTLDEALDEYLSGLRLKSSTRAVYTGAADHLKRGLGKLRLREVDSPEWERYLSARQSVGRLGQRKTFSLSHERRLLKAVLKDAQRRGELADVPNLRGFGKLPRHEYSPTEALVKTLCDGAAPVMRDLAVLACCTGMRLGELVSLRRRMVRRAEGHLIVQLEDGKTRAATLPQPVLHPAALEVLARRAAGDWLFPEYDTAQPLRKRVVLASKHYARERERLDLPKDMTFHSLRAFAASWGIRQGLDAVRLQRFLRHDRLETTMIYLRDVDRDPLGTARALTMPFLLPAKNDRK